MHGWADSVRQVSPAPFDPTPHDKSGSSGSAPHAVQLFIRKWFPVVIFHAHLLIPWRAGRDVLVRWRHLLIPADSHPAPFRKHQSELHPQHPRNTGRRHQLGVLVRAVLLSDDEFNDEVVRDRQTRGRLDVTERIRARFDTGHELHFNLAAWAVEVGLPPIFHVFVADKPIVLVKNTFALTTDFVRVLGTCG